MGRPTDNPKNTSIKFKADDETVRKLKECSEILNVSRAEVLRQGVHRMYDDLKKWKEAAHHSSKQQPLPVPPMPKGKLQHKYDTICCESFQALRTLKGDFYHAKHSRQPLLWQPLPKWKTTHPRLTRRKSPRRVQWRRHPIGANTQWNGKGAFWSVCGRKSGALWMLLLRIFLRRLPPRLANDARDSPGRVHRSFTA